MKDRAAISERDEGRSNSQLESFYRRYAAQVYTLCLRLLASVRAAEEATVQVFVRFSRELARRCEESQDLARLRELAIEEALERLKARGDKAEVNAAVNAPTQSGYDPTMPLDQTTLDRLVAQLPNSLRVAFVLRDREGLSDRAIAAHLRVDEAEVRSLAHRARLELVRHQRQPVVERTSES